eukprot:scaffold15149_cov37-Cyclotella_meneghiniana.AAC.2
MLKTATEIDPGVVSERNERGLTILHYAATGGRSTEFCKVIHDQNDTLVKIQDDAGWLPVHYACYYGDVKTAKYLLELYPDKDRGAVSTPTHDGNLPLHIACETKELVFVKLLLFDAHPVGIFVQDEDGNTPVDNARSNDKEDVVFFLQTQLEFHRQAHEDQERDNNGQLPIHRVLQMASKNVSLGTIKLMAEAHRASITVADIHECIPLHYACRFDHLDIGMYLVNNYNSLTTLDNGGNLPLHHACLAGKPDTINFILKATDHGVAVQNHDGKLPIQILLFDAICDRNLQYVGAVDSLFRANPIDSLAIISPGLFTVEK